MVTYLFSAYFIPVYVSFLIVKNCGFVMGFVILAIFSTNKQFFITIFDVLSGILKKTSVVIIFFHCCIY